MVEWFRRFGDIPGITYTTPDDLDPRTLEGYGAEPETIAFEMDGKRHESLNWSHGDMVGSSSPAHSRAFRSDPDASSSEVIQNCCEGLELPGEPSNYHFLIQHTGTELWRRRREEPTLIGEAERFFRLDIDLVDARPDAVSDEYEGERRFYAMAAFSTLVDLFEREGALHEALEVAEHGARYGQCERRRDELRERIAAVNAEGRE